jgi:hypothetical protein
MALLRHRLAAVATSLVVAAVAGCSASDSEVFDAEIEDADAAQTTATGALTVEGAAARSCTTSSVRGVAEQLVKEVMCLKPGLLAEIHASDKIELEPEVFPYLQGAAARNLEAGVAGYGKKITVTSALRTLPQQYLLRRWDARNRCGVRIAAPVGESNHEPGLAVDIKLLTSAENKKLRTSLASKGFTWLGAYDPVHFDFSAARAEDTVELGKLSVIAFKRLWNRNHPIAREQLPLNDTYDKTVEAKLRIAPADGFAIGSDCSDLPP